MPERDRLADNLFGEAPEPLSTEAWSIEITSLTELQSKLNALPPSNSEHGLVLA